MEEIGGVTKAGRKTKGNSKKAAKPRVRANSYLIIYLYNQILICLIFLLLKGSKKPAATIPPNTTGPGNRPESGSFANAQFPPSGPYGTSGPQGGPNSYRPDRPEGPYPPYPEFHNSTPGYYPSNQAFNQEFNSNYYPQQQQSQQQPQYGSNYQNQYPQSTPNCNQSYNQNYWSNSNYYGNTGYFDNPQYPNTQQQSDFTGNPSTNFNNQQAYPANFSAIDSNRQQYPAGQVPQYPGSQENFTNQRPSFQGPLNESSSSGYQPFNPNTPSTPNSYQNNQTPQDYSNTSFQPTSFAGNNPDYGTNLPPTYNQYDNRNTNFTGYENSMPSNVGQSNSIPNQTTAKTEIDTDPNYRAAERKPGSFSQNTAAPFENSFNFHQQNALYPDQPEGGSNGNYSCSYSNFSSNLESKEPLSSSGNPVTSWPLSDALKTEVDKIKNEDKAEIKSESDGEVKIEDLDTKKIVKDEIKRETSNLLTPPVSQILDTFTKDLSAKEQSKSDKSESDLENSKKGKQKGRGKDCKKAEKPLPRGRPKAKGRKDRKASKDKNNDESESEKSEKEEKMNKEEELAMIKKAEEVTYDWATELLKDYVPGIIENSAKMELFFYLLNESIKVGDRLLLFSQSLFTLNLIEDFLEKNFIPGTNCLWQRNTSYYRKYIS